MRKYLVMRQTSIIKERFPDNPARFSIENHGVQNEPEELDLPYPANSLLFWVEVLVGIMSQPLTWEEGGGAFLSNFLMA